MKPTRQVKEIIVGVIGRAQARFGMVIHAFQFLSNHFHMLLSPRDSRQAAAFMSYVKGNIAKEVGRITGWRDKFWSGRYHLMVISDEEEAQVARLKYVLSNGCKEGLVAHPAEWEGASTTQALLAGRVKLKGLWFDRTAQYRARQGGNEHLYATVETVTLSPLPCWQGLDPKTARGIVAGLVEKIAEETSAMHRNRGSSPMGWDRVLGLAFHEAPKALERSVAPLFYAATKGALQALQQGYEIFVHCYRQASARLRAGEVDVQFPVGSFPPPRPFVEGWAPG